MRVDTISRPATRPAAEAPNEYVANFRARVGGYVVDMVIFAAIAMLIVVAAGFVLLWSTDWAEQDASDADFYTFIAIIGLATPLIWTLLNVALLATRGQTGGQYVAGVRLADQDARPVSPGTALVWWFCFNPLLFSWPMALVAGAPLAALVALVVNVVSLFLLALIVLLCIAAPIVAFIAALTDAQNRALHDRIAGTVVLPVDER
jgi:uncharacterized RDD family membrane protein YckC